MDEQTKLRIAALGADILKVNPTAIFYMQKVSYHSLAVAIASGANGNPVVLDYDDFDFHAISCLGCRGSCRCSGRFRLRRKLRSIPNFASVQAGD